MAINSGGRMYVPNRPRYIEPTFTGSMKEAAGQALGHGLVALPLGLIGKGVDYLIGQSEADKAATRAEQAAESAGKRGLSLGAATKSMGEIDAINKRMRDAAAAGEVGRLGGFGAAPSPADGEQAAERKPMLDKPSMPSAIGDKGSALAPSATDTVFGPGALDKGMGKIRDLGSAWSPPRPVAAPLPASASGLTVPAGMTPTKIKVSGSMGVSGPVAGAIGKTLEDTEKVPGAMADAATTGARATEATLSMTDKARRAAEGAVAELGQKVQPGSFKPITYEQALNPKLTVAQQAQELGRILTAARSDPRVNEAEALLGGIEFSKNLADAWVDVANKQATATGALAAPARLMRNDAMEAAQEWTKIAATLESKRGGGGVGGGANASLIEKQYLRNEAALAELDDPAFDSKLAAWREQIMRQNPAFTDEQADAELNRRVDGYRRDLEAKRDRYQKDYERATRGVPLGATPGPGFVKGEEAGSQAREKQPFLPPPRPAGQSTPAQIATAKANIVRQMWVLDRLGEWQKSPEYNRLAAEYERLTGQRAPETPPAE